MKREGYVVVPRFIGTEDAHAAAASVLAAKSAWTPAFGGVQFSLGLAWYTHLEEGKSRDYFANAEASRARVEACVPGLVARLEAGVGRILGGPLVRRRGFAGPGIHVFPAEGACSRDGGDVHFDVEGLTPAERAAFTPAFTFVLMLQPAEHGGGLRIWDRTFEGGETDEGAAVSGEAPVACIAYEAGDLLAMDSYLLHQIEPFAGARDRISMTCHAVHSALGWQVWF